MTGPSTVPIQIINKSQYPLPAYATPGSSGMDIRSNASQAILVQPMQRVLVPTGIYVSIPLGYELQVRPRSGLAIKQGITCLNTPGTIDSDYRGEIQVILINLDTIPHSIAPGDRIAQLVCAKVEAITWHPQIQLDDTNRGQGGFGHTGQV